MRIGPRMCARRFSHVQSFATAALGLIILFVSVTPSANALPAFARKYGLRCSACHESWPMLNYFGQKFKDNGYQLMNDRDAPIWQNPSYWPVTFRITPVWHSVTTKNVLIDNYAGGVATGTSASQNIQSSGFDLSGLDFHTGGTLEKNFSFYVLPSSDPTASFHFETVMARLDNLLGTPWLNIKLGKFELDNLLSEKRILTLTANGGIYQLYHFIPAGDNNIFGQIGDNQLGLEVMGHSGNDRTRYSASLLSSSDGNVGLITGSNSYSGYFTASQAFDAGKLGVQRLGGYAMVGEAATYYRTAAGNYITGSGIANKGFTRAGFVGQFYFGPHVDVQVVTQYGSDNAWFGQGFGNPLLPNNGSATCTAPSPTCPPNAPPGTTLPVGSLPPSWNGVLVEPHYVFSPQLIFIGRYETIHMSQQSNGPGYVAGVTGPNGLTGTSPSDLGNISTYTLAVRWNPFMTSRAGFALHNEWNWKRQIGTGPMLGLSTPNATYTEFLSGFDFDF
jgi:hypothetical protein